MDDQAILERSIKAKVDFGVKCSKYAGSITVELIMQALQANGINPSQRDVFIRGLPIEVDLLIPRQGAEPIDGLLYEPQDVLVVLEIKNHGSFGDQTIRRIRSNFDRITKVNSSIHCIYVTLIERRGFSWAVTEENLGYPAYTLFWYSGGEKMRKYFPSGDWTKFLNAMRIVSVANAKKHAD